MARDGGLVALRADRMVDVEAGEVRAGWVVLVRGERIEALLDPGRPLPEGTALVELPGHTLLPGLIDCHTHLVGELQARASRPSTAAPPRRRSAGSATRAPP
jgi:imidazolonepropionase-like amidohydrolase